MIGNHVSFMIIAVLMMLWIDTNWLLMAAGFIGAIIIVSAYGWSIERVAYRPVNNSNRLIALISSIGMSIFLQNYVSLTESSRDVALPSLFSRQWTVSSNEDFSAFQKTLKNISVSKLILPAIDSSTVKQKLFLIVPLVIVVAWPFMVSRGRILLLSP